MDTLSRRINTLEKDHIECSARLNGTVAQLEKNDGEIFSILEKQYKKINSLPWKIFGIVGTTITILLTVYLFIFKISMQGIQRQYEDFTSKIVTLEIRNIHNEIERLHSSDKKDDNQSHIAPESL